MFLYISEQTVRVFKIRTDINMFECEEGQSSGSCKLDDWLLSILWPRQRELCHELGVV